MRPHPRSTHTDTIVPTTTLFRADGATARHAVAEGKLDMVGMTRAHLADPHIVNKIAAGREQEIRPCVGATYCLDRLYEGHEALCIHNPATGREARSEEHTSELQSLMRISYAVFCLKKKKQNTTDHTSYDSHNKHSIPHIARTIEYTA